jgi:FLVCR family MFS transporter
MAGVSMSYLIGPLMVKSDGSVTEIQQYLLVALCMSIVPFLLILIHLPSKPAVENAPSITATMARTDFFLAAKQLFSYQQKGFWLLVLAFGIMTGSYQSWGPLYALLVGKLGENVNIDDAQATAGWIGFWSNIASNAGGLVVSVWCDSMHASKKKNVLLGLSLGAVIVLAVFGGLTLHKPWLDAAGLPAIYALCILASIFTQSTCPLFFELAVDEVFPIGEGIATNVLTAMQNLYIMLFLFIPTFGITVSLWVIWLTLGACIISSLALLGFTPALRRTEIDAGQKQEVH